MKLKISSILVFFSLLVANLCAAQAHIEIIKKRIVDEAMNSAVDDSQAESLINNLKPNGTWPDINYEDVSREAFEHRRHLSNMVYLARAFTTRSSKYYRSRKLKNALELALGNWVQHDYICDNWWHNQIGTPNSLVTLLLIVGADLNKELVEKTQPIINRANVDAPGARPGGDRIKIAGIEAKNHLFLGNAEKFDQVIKVIENEIKYVEWVGRFFAYTYSPLQGGFSNRSAGGRGIQYGNSFHHRTDGVNNTLSYGLGYADAFVEWADYTRDTPYAFAPEKLEKLIDYYLDGICKMAVFGKFPDAGAKNRSISRQGALEPYNTTTPEKLLRTSDYRKFELMEIMNIRKNGAISTISHATLFWNTEHFSVQRPMWFASVRMYSTRNHNMEVPYNSEGLLNHHRGDGANHISRTGDEYADIWPVYDYQKIPGTTVVQKPALPAPDQIQKLGKTDFVGAATNGICGAAAFDFNSPHDDLVARKAWFFFEDEYVCLGAGISARGELPVVTTLNQCLLRDKVLVSSNNRQTELTRAEKEYKNVDWVYQDSVGYVFPEPTNVHIKNNEAEGSWWRISKQSTSSKEKLSLDLFKLWLDHGTRPDRQKYAYTVVPAAQPADLSAVAKRVEILSNTSSLQAVVQKKLNMCQAVFYKAGQLQINSNLTLTADNPGIVVLEMNGNQVKKITVADPNRELENFHLSVSPKIEKSGEAYSAVWEEEKQVTHFRIALPQDNFAGSSISIVL